MFGPNMVVTLDGVSVRLRAFRREEMALVAEGFSNAGALQYTNQLFSQTLENEQEWYDKVRQSGDSSLWAIVPEGADDVPVGTTGLEHIHPIHGSAISGIIIFDREWWGKGVATRAHLARTLFAADYLNRSTIQSHVRVANPASLKALQRVGYHVTGVSPRSLFRAGTFNDTYDLTWLNPDKVSVLYPDGVPEEYAEAVAKAADALKLARGVVTLP